MAPSCARALAVLLVVAVAAPHFTAQPNAEDADASAHSRVARQLSYRSRKVAPKLGFFGTIFHLILEQVNDTKSAYNQVSDLVSNQFVEGIVPTTPPPVNGSTAPPKISRAEFLKILDRNLKGLTRLRNLEWREARKDTRKNIQAYKEEIFNGKKPRKR